MVRSKNFIALQDSLGHSK